MSAHMVQRSCRVPNNQRYPLQGVAVTRNFAESIGMGSAYPARHEISRYSHANYRFGATSNCDLVGVQPGQRPRRKNAVVAFTEGAALDRQRTAHEINESFTLERASSPPHQPSVAREADASDNEEPVNTALRWNWQCAVANAAHVMA